MTSIFLLLSFVLLRMCIELILTSPLHSAPRFAADGSPLDSGPQSNRRSPLGGCGSSESGVGKGNFGGLSRGGTVGRGGAGVPNRASTTPQDTGRNRGLSGGRATSPLTKTAQTDSSSSAIPKSASLGGDSLRTTAQSDGSDNMPKFAVSVRCCIYSSS